jgi:hypothetical protein
MTSEDEPVASGAQNPSESGTTSAVGSASARGASVSPARKKSEALAAALRANLARRKARVRALRNAGATDDSEG